MGQGNSIVHPCAPECDEVPPEGANNLDDDDQGRH